MAFNYQKGLLNVHFKTVQQKEFKNSKLEYFVRVDFNFLKRIEKHYISPENSKQKLIKIRSVNYKS